MRRPEFLRQGIEPQTIQEFAEDAKLADLYAEGIAEIRIKVKENDKEEENPFLIKEVDKISIENKTREEREKDRAEISKGIAERRGLLREYGLDSYIPKTNYVRGSADEQKADLLYAVAEKKVGQLLEKIKGNEEKLLPALSQLDEFIAQSIVMYAEKSRMPDISDINLLVDSEGKLWYIDSGPLRDPRQDLESLPGYIRLQLFALTELEVTKERFPRTFQALEALKK